MSEITFNADKKHRDKYFTAAHFAHPAKMVLPLERWIIENYTKLGETILDPMAGSGTLLIACTMGRNVVCVELEEKFVKMQRDNWAKIQTLGPEMGYSMGTALILQGDARNLEGLCDSIITSPPYAECGKDMQVKGLNSRTCRKQADRPVDYAPSDSNLGNLPYGKIDSIITSPPYEGSVTGTPGIDWAKCDGGKRDRTKEPRIKSIIAGMSGYTVDSIITSPPYEHQIHKNSDEGKEELIKAINPSHYVENSQPVAAARYNPSADNIGNLKSDSYLSAMLQVYQQCHKVLKPNGLMILVTKNFIRNKQEIRLDTDTIKLCETAGFTFAERHYRHLTSQSFWRVIYQQKFPDAPVLDKEDILVFQRSKQRC
jgi:DNA modification methylase